MKKIVLVLIFSLGLVSAVNANGVCEEVKAMKEIGALERMVSYINDRLIDEKRQELSKTLHNLILSHHIKEFKIDDKESICAYMNVYDMSFENVKLSQDEITKFERYMAENGNYESYEKSKDKYLWLLKFFTYYRNQIPSRYDTKSIYKAYEALDSVYSLKEYNGDIALYRYVYGKKQGKYMTNYSFDNFKNDVALLTKCSEATVNSKEELAKCQRNKKILPPILKWAESNMKQSKQKGGKNE